MTDFFGPDEIKHKVRMLKRIEIKIRFGGICPEKPAASLVWDRFFDLGGRSGRTARYSAEQLAGMDKETLKRVIDEFYAQVYYCLYQDQGIVSHGMFDPSLLSTLDLPAGSDTAMIKKRFRELALKYHPDTGGDPARFIELMHTYRELVEKGRMTR
jgi:hypothetical protein